MIIILPNQGSPRVKLLRGDSMVHSVTTVDWQNILKLLMLTMLSDGRVYEREVDTFVNASLNLRANMDVSGICLLYTSPSPRDRTRSRMPSSA